MELNNLGGVTANGRVTRGGGEPGALTEQLCDLGRREHPRRLHFSPVKWAGWIRWLSFFPLLKRLQLTYYHSHFHYQQYRKSKELCILLDMGEWLAGKIRLENSLLSFSRGFSPANPESPSTPATWLHWRHCPLLLPVPWGMMGKQSDWGHSQMPPAQHHNPRPHMIHSSAFLPQGSTIPQHPDNPGVEEKPPDFPTLSTALASQCIRRSPKARGLSNSLLRGEGYGLRAWD